MLTERRCLPDRGRVTELSPRHGATGVLCSQPPGSQKREGRGGDELQLPWDFRAFTATLL